MAKLSVEVGKPLNDEQSAPRRNHKAVDGAWATPKGLEDVQTIYELFKHGVKTFGNKRCMGQRKQLKVHVERKKVKKLVEGKETEVEKEWQYYEMSPYEFISFNELEELVTEVASGLVALGVKPGEERFHLYSRTCSEWMQTFLALTCISVTSVTAYDTLGSEGLNSSINETETVGILTDAENLHVLAKTLPDCPSIRYVVYRDYDGPLQETELNQLKKIEGIRDIKTIAFSELRKLGRENPVEAVPPKKDDLCCIMYTSGSTGKPKGVILLHSTVLAGVGGASGNISQQWVRTTDQFLNILPLAHIFELTAELCMFVWGAALGYGQPKTVSDVSVRNCKGDIRELAPTVMAAVPAVYEQIKKGIIAKVRQQRSIAQSVFWHAYRAKVKLRTWGLPVPLVDTIIFKKIKAATGGNLRYIMNGGSALSEESRIFMHTLIAPLLMGYGLTETNAMAALTAPNQIDFHSCGEPVPSVTIKLVDVAEAGYFARNGQGEVWIQGPCVSPGYFLNDKETNDAYTEDEQGRWFKTGDIGQWTANGSLSLIDRKKNLVKTLRGEYIALERLEALYRSNEFVKNICVFADDQHAKPVAVVVLNPASVETLCEQLGVEYSDSVTSSDKNVHRKIVESIQQTGKDNDLKPAEILADIAVFDEEWTPQNGYVTSAQKVQRRKIKEDAGESLKKAFDNA